MGKAGRGRGPPAEDRSTSLVDVKRFKEDATQSSSQLSFLDSPDDPYFFPDCSDHDDGAAAPKTSASRPKSAPKSNGSASRVSGSDRTSSRTSGRGKIPALKQERGKGEGASRKKAGRVEELPNCTATASQTLRGDRLKKEGRAARKPAQDPATETQESTTTSLLPAAAPVLRKPTIAKQTRLSRLGPQKGAPDAAASKKAATKPARQSRLARTTTPADPVEPVQDSNPKEESSLVAQKRQPVTPVALPKPAATTPKLPLTSPQNGLRTPLLMRNALSAGLGRLLSNSLFKNPAPAVTVTEAQESGEQMEIQDSMLYALDGLCSSSEASHRQSAASLAEICSTRRGREAFRTEGVIQEAVSTAARVLSAKWDVDVALPFSAILFAFSRDSSNQAAVTSRECLQLLSVILKGFRQHSPAADLSSASERRSGLFRGLQEEAQGVGLPPELASEPPALALLAVVGVTDPQLGGSNAEAMKSGLRRYGLLETLARFCLMPTEPHMDIRSLWYLHTALASLENCSFACPENETFLVSLKLAKPQAGALEFVSVLVGVVQQLVQEEMTDDRQPLAKACVQCSLSVLMNLTHHNSDGCRLVRDSGGMETAAQLLSSTVKGAQRWQLLAALDTITVCMCLLINLVENRPLDTSRLIDLPLPENGRLLPMLCRLMKEIAPQDGGQQRGAVAESGEVTADELAEREEESMAGIMHVYAAVLVGFLATSSRGSRAEAAAVLGDSSLTLVVDGIHRCLQFYTDVGAIAEKTERSLRDLLGSLSVKPA